MSTSRNKPRISKKGKSTKPRRSYVPATALAKAVECDDLMLHVTFVDGRILGVPLIWFPALRQATPQQRAACEIAGAGTGLHWPELDEDLSVAGLMAGVDRRSA